MTRPRKTFLLLALLSGACYSYQTIPVEDVRPDLPVRLRVKPEAAEHVADVVGYLTQNVDGTIISLSRDTVLLNVRSPMPADPTPRLNAGLESACDGTGRRRPSEHSDRRP